MVQLVPRPPQVLFNPELVRERFPSDVIQKTGTNSFKFRNRSYVDGLPTYSGTTGTVTSVHDKFVVVRDLADARGRVTPGSVHLSLYEIRRVLKPGHYVTIKVGANVGQSGLITSVHDTSIRDE